jgi:hypothetical protein
VVESEALSVYGGWQSVNPPPPRTCRYVPVIPLMKTPPVPIACEFVNAQTVWIDDA